MYPPYFQPSTPTHYPISEVPGETKANCLLQSLIGRMLEVLVQEVSKNRPHTNAYQVSSFSVLFLKRKFT